jgi:endonuclease/exonuclease/phosphatase family metal-dependent hydrolase
MRWPSVTVMTRNVYLGADTNRPIQEARAARIAGGTPQDVLVALANATHATREIVDRTDFGVRAGLLADEIVRSRPALVGLQEMALWRSRPLELTSVGVPQAETVDHDYLELLLSALRARDAHYTAVVIGRRADVETPSFTGSPFDGTLGSPRNVRMTMRDVILVRVGAGVRVTDRGDAVFEHNLAIEVAGMTMNVDRGYQWVDARVGRRRFRFVNTHLENLSSDVALAQAREVLARAAAPGRATVLVGDFNSDPLDDSVKQVDTVPRRAAYDLIVGSGFTDAWLSRAPAEAGWTAGLSERVDDDAADGFDHRIDMVFARGGRDRALPVESAEVTGTALAHRDPTTGLWASDHGGVVVRVRPGFR